MEASREAEERDKEMGQSRYRPDCPVSLILSLFSTFQEMWSSSKLHGEVSRKSFWLRLSRPVSPTYLIDFWGRLGLAIEREELLHEGLPWETFLLSISSVADNRINLANRFNGVRDLLNNAMARDDKRRRGFLHRLRCLRTETFINWF